jgi:hypothetical protein
MGHHAHYLEQASATAETPLACESSVKSARVGVVGGAILVTLLLLTTHLFEIHIRVVSEMATVTVIKFGVQL